MKVQAGFDVVAEVGAEVVAGVRVRERDGRTAAVVGAGPAGVLDAVLDEVLRKLCSAEDVGLMLYGAVREAAQRLGSGAALAGCVVEDRIVLASVGPVTIAGVGDVRLGGDGVQVVDPVVLSPGGRLGLGCGLGGAASLEGRTVTRAARAWVEAALDEGEHTSCAVLVLERLADAGEGRPAPERQPPAPVHPVPSLDARPPTPIASPARRARLNQRREVERLLDDRTHRELAAQRSAARLESLYRGLEALEPGAGQPLPDLEPIELPPLMPPSQEEHLAARAHQMSLRRFRRLPRLLAGAGMTVVLLGGLLALGSGDRAPPVPVQAVTNTAGVRAIRAVPPSLDQDDRVGWWELQIPESQTEPWRVELRDSSWLRYSRYSPNYGPNYPSSAAATIAAARAAAAREGCSGMEQILDDDPSTAILWAEHASCVERLPDVPEPYVVQGGFGPVLDGWSPGLRPASPFAPARSGLERRLELILTRKAYRQGVLAFDAGSLQAAFRRDLYLEIALLEALQEQATRHQDLLSADPARARRVYLLSAALSADPDWASIWLPESDRESIRAALSVATEGLSDAEDLEAAAESSKLPPILIEALRRGRELGP